MREERIIRSLAAALTALALLFAVAFLLAGLELARLVLFCGLAFAVIGIAVGTLLGKRHPVMQILLSAAPGAALAWLAGRIVMIEPAYLYSLVAIGVLLAVWAERLYVTTREASLSAGALLAPLAGWLCTAGILYLTVRERPDTAQIWPFVIIPASVWFIVAMVALNRRGVRQAARANTGSGVPAAVRRNGTVGAVLFIAATFLFANASAIMGFIADGLKKLVAWAVVAFYWLSSLLSPSNTGGQSPQGGDQQQPLPMGGEGSPLMQLIGDIVMVVMLVCIAAAIIFGLYKLFPKLWQKLRERLNTLFGTWRDSEDFRDSSERLMTLRQAFSNAGKGLRKLARLFRRRERIGDFTTNAGRARFLFREYVRDLIASGHRPRPAATASDIARPVPALAHAYNLARYGEEEPSDGEVESAREEVFK